MLYFNEVHGRLGNERVCASVQRTPHMYIPSFMYIQIIYIYIKCNHTYTSVYIHSTYIRAYIIIYYIIIRYRPATDSPSGFYGPLACAFNTGRTIYIYYTEYPVAFRPYTGLSTTQVREHGGVRAVYNTIMSIRRSVTGATE